MKPRVIVVRPLPEAALVIENQHHPTFDVVFSGDFRDVIVSGRDLVVQIRAHLSAASPDAPSDSPLIIGQVKGGLFGVPDLYGHYYLKLTGPANVAGALSSLNASPDARTRLGYETPQVAFAFDYKVTDTAKLISFALPADLHGHTTHGAPSYAEGDSWLIDVHCPELDITSPAFPVAWRRSVVPSRFHKYPSATYDWHAGNHIQFFTDASKNSDGTAGAFHEIAAAIEAAQKFIFIVDWSFHPTMRLNPNDHSLEGTIGATLLRKATQGVVVAVLTWFHAQPAAELANERAWDLIKAIANKVGPEYPPNDNLMWRANTRSERDIVARNASFYSHHQKFIVTDVPGPGRSDIQVFYGGLDLTKGRFDCASHGILEDDPDVSKLTRNLTEKTLSFPSMEPEVTDWVWEHGIGSREKFDDWYNAEFNAVEMPDGEGHWVRQPWHDIHAHLRGPVAWDFAREFVMRWSNTNFTAKESTFFTPNAVEKVSDLFFKTLMDRSQFRQQWEQARPASPWTGQLLHSFESKHLPFPVTNPRWHPKRKEFKWHIHNSDGGGSIFERSIQDSYLKAIANADRFIHIENQYFIGSGSRWKTPNSQVENGIPGAIVDRIIQKARAERDFHAYIVIPMMPEGDATSLGMAGVRNQEWRTIAWMISAIRSAGFSDWNKYLSFYFQAYGHGVPDRTIPSLVKGSTSVRRMRLTKANKRYMIYIHSKLMIVDDRYVILGSANINERSMAGDRDSEICLAIWPSTSNDAPGCGKQIYSQLRGPLLSEYFGSAAIPSGYPESEAFRLLFQKNAQSNYVALRNGKKPAGHLMMFPFDAADDGETLTTASWLPASESVERHKILLDGLWTPALPDPDEEPAIWSWAPALPSLFKKSGTARSLVE